jgi:hypothetical protein
LVVIGDMVYDPIKQQWNGNEQALMDFERTPGISSHSQGISLQRKTSTASIQTAKVRPALITNKGISSKLPQVVGQMVFDPVRMCWLGNEEDDVFNGFDDENDGNDSGRRAGALKKMQEGNMCINLFGIFKLK